MREGATYSGSNSDPIENLFTIENEIKPKLEMPNSSILEDHKIRCLKMQKGLGIHQLFSEKKVSNKPSNLFIFWFVESEHSIKWVLFDPFQM